MSRKRPGYRICPVVKTWIEAGAQPRRFYLRQELKCGAVVGGGVHWDGRIKMKSYCDACSERLLKERDRDDAAELARVGRELGLKPSPS